MTHPPSIALNTRVSYESNICTVRYIGPVDGQDPKITWIGVEWDDPSRGKHDGCHNGKRYFFCKSLVPTAASFLKSTRSPDPSRSFIQAVKLKYAGEDPQRSFKSLEHPNVISGKVVEEVGFDKIQEQQRRLHDLKVVLVDGQQIDVAEDKVDEPVQILCPSIVELDLSRNLLPFPEVFRVISPHNLPHLRLLKLNGNHFYEDQNYFDRVNSSLFPATIQIVELHMDDVLLSWSQLCSILQFSLEVLRLKGNNITSIDREPYVLAPFHRFGDKLRYVDLSYNAIASWKFVDDLDYCFPGLAELRLSHNPVYETSTEDGASSSADEGYMLTLARIKNLTGLNFSKITAADRSNAEMFYLSRIARAVAEVPEAEAASVTGQHKRYAELCEKYGQPTIARKTTDTINPGFVEARLIKFTFYLPPGAKDEQVERVTISKEIPKSFDVYRVKGIVGKMFTIPPLSLRLIWETGEWDPVAGYEEEEDSSDDEEEQTINPETQAIREKGRWMKREVEVEESTRLIGNCVDGLEATVRVELR
ncbi:hypothetical protein EG329_001080 [Mollisiaceae sp. DMI_Dod_QoI]|nr:hypothetical protein EG329_001080 [Helotiales sp. DMI_Dod_QoI]